MIHKTVVVNPNKDSYCCQVLIVGVVVAERTVVEGELVVVAVLIEVVVMIVFPIPYSHERS